MGPVQNPVGHVVLFTQSQIQSVRSGFSVFSWSDNNVYSYNLLWFICQASRRMSVAFLKNKKVCVRGRGEMPLLPTNLCKVKTC